VFQRSKSIIMLKFQNRFHGRMMSLPEKLIILLLPCNLKLNFTQKKTKTKIFYACWHSQNDVNQSTNWYRCNLYIVLYNRYGVNLKKTTHYTNFNWKCQQCRFTILNSAYKYWKARCLKRDIDYRSRCS